MKINYPAVLVAAILHWILGAVWYGIFTNKFVELMAWTPQQLSELEPKSYERVCPGLSFIPGAGLRARTLYAVYEGHQPGWWPSDSILALARLCCHVTDSHSDF